MILYFLVQSRKSLSAMHNNNDAKITTSISKSYANNKKEELMKVINEAKAKLENVSISSDFTSKFKNLIDYSFERSFIPLLRYHLSSSRTFKDLFLLFRVENSSSLFPVHFSRGF